EPALGGPIGRTSPDWISGSSLADGVDLLLHDAQYSEGEYADKIGWGHSSAGAPDAFRPRSTIPRPLLSHLDHALSAERSERLKAEARALAGGNEEPPALAHEGMVVDVG